MSGPCDNADEAAGSGTVAHAAPLTGISVVDFTRVLAGPTATRILAEMGASVTKVEPPASDIARAASPTAGATSGYYLQLNGGKRNLSIDLNFPEGRAAVFELCRRADVIVENYRPGTMATFGLDYESVSAVNPAVVYVSISGYGQDNPWSSRPAFAPTVQAESGSTATHLRHYGDLLARPTTDSTSQADLYTGVQGALAAVAGLFQRSVTGRGSHADVSMMATMLSVNERLHMEANELDPMGEPAALSAPESPIFELADGSLITIAASPVWTPAFGRYCTMMGRNDLKADPRYTTPELRREHYDELMTEVAAWIRTFAGIDELEHQVSGAGGLAVGRIRTSGEALDTEWAEAVQPYYTVETEGRELRLMRGPWKFDGQSTAALRPAAAQGADNAEIMAEIGATIEQIADLTKRGVLRSDG
ncbi:CaiB/BaiF CoA transferase family protein [Candidatus Poriferisodalis sp.]|uniref:CaiB/BaiF CoA transferase family protein n=1 Tax=Candidatus Poriferisodalis sp. TaxID=3101277 RepID=UPI003B0295AD